MHVKMTDCFEIESTKRTPYIRGAKEDWQIVYPDCFENEAVVNHRFHIYDIEYLKMKYYKQNRWLHYK